MCSVVDDTVTNCYVVTSDQEKAIRSGLELSQMADVSIQFFCALHAKWNVRDHSYVHIPI